MYLSRRQQAGHFPLRSEQTCARIVSILSLRHDMTIPTAFPIQAPPAFHLLAKPTGATCNLDCDYCFFLSKEMLYPGSRFRMADEMLESYIRQLIEGHQAPEVIVAWQGGEPTLMGLDFFRRSIEYQRKYLRPGMTVQNTIQTNGTLINDEWAAFFRENNFLVGLSIDGPAANARRLPPRQGRPTHLRSRDPGPGLSEKARSRVQRPGDDPPRQRRPSA